ncbi:MAG: matrixin family metalloprotease [Phycisphaerales bacterium]|nr:MAG: matrixin family metalloprotease [Phycisphaerales bacterium]
MGSRVVPCAAWGWWIGFIACTLFVAAGCSTVGSGPQSAEAASPSDSETSDLSGVDDNDDMNVVIMPPAANGDMPTSGPFADAAFFSLNDSQVTIEGTISDPSDVDIYDIGPVSAGDQIVIDVQAQSDLDAAAAVFDANENLVYANDDRAYYAKLLDPMISVQIRHDSAHCYVAIASSFSTGTRGDYVVSVTHAAAPGPVEVDKQHVYLNFDGAVSVVIGTRPAVDVPAFEGSLIAPEFEGQTDELIDRIMELVRQDFAGVNVEFVSSREGERPVEPHSTVHFGAYDQDLLGIAENIDEYNERLVQQAVVFVDTFRAFLPLSPSVDEMAQVLANVASHETAHLLGLQHTNDPHSIMDVTATLRQMMGPQSFLRAPLDEYVFPIGYQDGPQLLVEAVGGDLATAKAAAAQQLNLRALWYDEDTGPAARKMHSFSACFCPGCAKARAARQGRSPS